MYGTRYFDIDEVPAELLDCFEEIETACGAPWERVVEHSEPDKETTRGRQAWTQVTGQRDSSGGLPVREHITVDWQPTCSCAAAVIPCTVLDPFNGSGTTGAVALKHHRHYIGIDLNADYLELAHDRIRQTQPLLMQVTP